MELRARYYILALVIISSALFAVVVTYLQGTTVAYIDFLLSMAVMHYVLSKFIKIKKKKAEI